MEGVYETSLSFEAGGGTRKVWGCCSRSISDFTWNSSSASLLRLTHRCNIVAVAPFTQINGKDNRSSNHSSSCQVVPSKKQCLSKFDYPNSTANVVALFVLAFLGLRASKIASKSSSVLDFVSTKKK